MRGPLRFFAPGAGQRVPVLAWAREVPLSIKTTAPLATLSR